MSKINIAIIGAGKIGMKLKSKNFISNYFDACKKNFSNKIIDIYDLNSGPNYKNFSKNRIKKKKYDLVIICTPDKTHLSVMKKIFETQVPNFIILEKLPTNNYKEFLEMIKLTKSVKTKIIINFFRRYLHVYKKLKKEISNEKPIFLEFTFSQSILRNGSHYVDLMFFLLNKKFTDILKVEKNNIDKNISIKFKNCKTRVLLKQIDGNYNLDECSVYFKKKHIMIKNISEEFLKWEISKRYNNFNINYLKLKKILSSKKFDIFKSLFEEIKSNNNKPQSSIQTSTNTMKFLKKLQFIK